MNNKEGTMPRNRDFLALYRGASIPDSYLVAVSADPAIVRTFIDGMCAKVAGEEDAGTSEATKTKAQTEPPPARVVSK